MKLRIAAALLLATLAAGCVNFNDVWRQAAEYDCDQNYQGSRRLDCYQSVTRQAQENARR